MRHVAEMERVYARKGRKTAVAVGGDFNLLEQPGFENEQTVEILKTAGFHWIFEGVPLAERISWPPRGRYSGASFDHFFTCALGTAVARVLPISGAQ